VLVLENGDMSLSNHGVILNAAENALGGVDTYLIHKMMAARVTTAR
jgi:hypothetical protein